MGGGCRRELSFAPRQVQFRCKQLFAFPSAGQITLVTGQKRSFQKNLHRTPEMERDGQMSTIPLTSPGTLLREDPLGGTSPCSGCPASSRANLEPTWRPAGRSRGKWVWGWTQAALLRGHTNAKSQMPQGLEAATPAISGSPPHHRHFRQGHELLSGFRAATQARCATHGLATLLGTDGGTEKPHGPSEVTGGRCRRKGEAPRSTGGGERGQKPQEQKACVPEKSRAQCLSQEGPAHHALLPRQGQHQLWGDFLSDTREQGHIPRGENGLNGENMRGAGWSPSSCK